MNRQRMITFPLMQYIVIALVMIILQSCANPLPPTGGPRDTEGPLIIRTIPKDRTIGFNEKLSPLNSMNMLIGIRYCKIYTSLQP